MVAERHGEHSKADGVVAVDSYTAAVQSPVRTGEKDDVKKEMMALTHGPHLLVTTRGERESGAARA